MIVIGWILTVFLWIVAGAFVISNILLVFAVIHHRKDREMVTVLIAVILLFCVFSAGAAYAALGIGGQLR